MSTPIPARKRRRSLRLSLNCAMTEEEEIAYALESRSTRAVSAELVPPIGRAPCRPRQGKLFAGLDCLAGQRDLFDTDGVD